MRCVTVFLFLVALLIPGLAGSLAGQCEVGHLTVPGAADYDQLGIAVAIDGVRVLAGAHAAQGIVPDSGTATIFESGPSGWVSTATLMASDGMPYDGFGLAVDLDGDVAVVGAPSADDLGAYSGAAYVFRFDGTAWVEEAELLASDGGIDDAFGVEVAVDGDTIVVGASYALVQGVRSGAAYIFERVGGTWVEVEKLTPSTPQLFDQFGAAVSVSGDDVIVGVPGHTVGLQSTGSAVIYHHDGTAWSFETELTASDADVGDFFGFSVDLDGGTAVIGAIENCLCSVPPAPPGTGTAYIFRHDGTVWSEETQLVPSGGQLEQWFGAAVSISGDDVVVGAWNANGAVVASGAAYLYGYDGVVWNETAVLLADDGGISDGFGRSVSIRGGVAAVGAPLHDDGGDGTGTTYVFTIGPGGCDSDFIRGDCNRDGGTDIADAIHLLAALFPGGTVPPILGCRDACDANDDASLNIADSIATLAALFGAPAVPLPQPAVCGPDPTQDGLSCPQYGACP